MPNGNLAGRQFINYSAPDRIYREAIDIVLDFSALPARAENVLLAAVLATEGLAEGRPHHVRIKGFSERGVLYEVQFWINDYADRARLRHRISSNILRQLTHAGISIPHEQHEVYVSKERRLRQERRIEPHRLLSRVSWLGTLSAAEFVQLGEIVTGREFAAGDVLVRQGDTGQTLRFLVEGLLEVSITAADGTQARVGLIEPGDAFGEMSFLTGAPRTATVTAHTDGYAFEIQPKDFEPILRARPELAGELGRMMAIRGVSLRQTAAQRDAKTDAEITTRAGQIAKRIREFFDLAAGETKSPCNR